MIEMMNGARGEEEGSKGEASLGDRQESSYPLGIKKQRPACVPPASPPPPLKLGAPVGKEWRDASGTGRGCSGCRYRLRYAGIQAGKYASEITCPMGAGVEARCGGEGGRVSDRPASNSM